MVIFSNFTSFILIVISFLASIEDKTYILLRLSSVDYTNASEYSKLETIRLTTQWTDIFSLKKILMHIESLLAEVELICQYSRLILFWPTFY